MNIKEFYEVWTEQEINDYLSQFGILVLFKIHLVTKEAEVVVHGNITDEQVDQLKGFIALLFGGVLLSKPICGKINEFAEKWHNKYVLNKKAHIINYKRKDKK